MSYGDNKVYYRTIRRFLEELDKLCDGNIFCGQSIPPLPQNYPWKDAIIDIGKAIKAETIGRWGKLSDVTIFPYCHVWWSVGCKGCTYGIKFGKCGEPGSLYDKHFSKPEKTICIRSKKNFKKMLDILREGIILGKKGRKKR